MEGRYLLAGTKCSSLGRRVVVAPQRLCLRERLVRIPQTGHSLSFLGLFSKEGKVIQRTNHFLSSIPAEVQKGFFRVWLALCKGPKVSSSRCVDRVWRSGQIWNGFLKANIGAWVIETCQILCQECLVPSPWRMAVFNEKTQLWKLRHSMHYLYSLKLEQNPRKCRSPILHLSLPWLFHTDATEAIL